MNELTFDELEQHRGGTEDCAKAVVIGAGVGSFFGGVGTIVGAGLAATGPECLGWW